MRNLKWAFPLLVLLVSAAVYAEDAKPDKPDHKGGALVGTLDKAPDGKADILATLKNKKGDVYNLTATKDDVKKALTDLQGKVVKVKGSGDKDKYTVDSIEEFKGGDHKKDSK